MLECGCPFPPLTPSFWGCVRLLQAQNLDVNGLDILLTELKLRKMEIVSGGMKQAPPAPREPL